MRGKPLSDYDGSGTNRITPAGAGKTTMRGKILRVVGDHPRRCGENPVRIHAHAQSAGSPPQVRGKQRYAHGLHRRRGITPAGAGKTSSGSFFCPRYWDHPRRCGENYQWSAVLRIGRGSPPQVRGKRPFTAATIRSMRITPAGAGKTVCFSLVRLFEEDHPRRCGENRNRQRRLSVC